MMLPIYGRTMHCYQMDTLEQSDEAKRKGNSACPPYYLVIININSRKGHVYPMMKKDAEHVKEVLTRFLKTHQVTHLYTDSDPAYTHKPVANLLTQHNVTHNKTSNDNKHALGIVNRFIKTLRDKNGYERDITNVDMNEIVEEYNNTKHSTTGYAPNQWTKEIDEEWIDLKHREMMSKQGAFLLKTGQYVRIPKNNDVFSKKRVNYEPELYPVTGVDGNRFQVLKDGKVVTFSRFQLREPYKDEKVNELKSADNVVVKILRWDKDRPKSYFCLWEDGSKDWTTISSLRGTAPNRLCQLEREYWHGKPLSEIPLDDIKEYMPEYISTLRVSKRLHKSNA